MPVAERRGGVRTARPGDVGDVVAIEERCFEVPNTALLIRICGASDTLYVYERADAVVGYVLSAPTSATRARVISLAVASPYRGRGVGTALMRRTLDRWHEKDVGVVELEVRVSNDPAITLYRKLGFEVVATKEEYYEDGEDAYLMRVGLADPAACV